MSLNVWYIVVDAPLLYASCIIYSFACGGNEITLRRKLYKFVRSMHSTIIVGFARILFDLESVK